MAQSGAAREARESLEREFPGVAVLERGERVTTVFGRPMTRAATARAAMEDWMDLYQPVFGVEDLEWVESRGAEISGGRVAFALRQEVTVEGGILTEPTALPVEGGRLRALVTPDGEDFAVTYVAARVADTDGGIAAPQITGAQAIAAAGEDERTAHLEVWGEPELLVVEMDLGTGPEVFAAWRLVGQESEEAFLTSLIVHVDAVTGDVVRVQSGVVHAADPVTGTVEGKSTSGLGPPLTSTVGTFPLPDLIVSIVGESSTTTEIDGSYELETASSSVDVEASLDAGHWIVQLGQGLTTPMLSLLGVTPPASGQDFLFLANPTVEDLATVNAYLNVQRSNDMFRRFVPDWTSTVLPTIDDVEVRPNLDCGTCNAFYSQGDTGPKLRFCIARANQCHNSAYSTIVSHEYGHYIADYVIGEPVFGGGAFHEGYADSLAMLVHDTGVIGDNFYLGVNPAWVREPSTANTTYPACGALCPGCEPQCALLDCQPGTDLYGNGMLLGRLWWDIRNTIEADPTQLFAAQRLFANWTMLSGGAAPGAGGYPCDLFVQPADEGTLLEVLIADDDDTILSNGTPNEEVICAAFASRNIFLTGNYGVCNESAGGGAGCRADLNYDGVLDIFDFLEFESMFAAGDLFCDFDGDGELDFFDFLEFQNEFVAGCW